MNKSGFIDIAGDFIFENRPGPRTVMYETMLFVAEKDGGFVPVKTLFRPDEIIAVQSSGLDVTYKENVDYSVTDGAILALAGTSMPFFRYDEYFPAVGEQGKSFPMAEGHLVFGEGPYFHNRQISVSYRSSEVWKGPQVKAKSEKFPNTYKKIKAGQLVNVLFNGDSITTGANSSGCARINVKPFMPPFPDMFAAVLEKTHNITVNLANIAVGGTRSAWGIEQNNKYLDENAANNAPDLCVVAFGMNDGSGKITVADYISNIKKIISDTRALCPLCEFILVATMLPNPILPGFAGPHRDYEGALLGLENGLPGIAVADVTEMHGYLLTRKRYQDMTGNNVNHPNDFLARVYAQVLLKTFGINTFFGVTR